MSVSAVQRLRFVAESPRDPLAAPLLAGLADEYARRWHGGRRS
jgi:hypothetical protein